MLLFNNDDDSEESDEDNVEAPAAGASRNGILDQTQQLESNEGSSIRAPGITVANGGRPQRKSKSKKNSFPLLKIFTRLPASSRLDLHHWEAFYES